MGAEEPRTNLGGAVPFCILGPTQSLKSVAHPGPAPPCPAYLSRSLPQLPPAAGVCGIRTPCKVTSASATPVMRTVTMQQRLSALPSCPRHRGDAWPPYSRPSFPESRELFSLLSHSLRNVTGNIQLCRLWATTAPQVRMGSGPSPEERQAPTEAQKLLSRWRMRAEEAEPWPETSGIKQGLPRAPVQHLPAQSLPAVVARLVHSVQVQEGCRQGPWTEGALSPHPAPNWVGESSQWNRVSAEYVEPLMAVVPRRGREQARPLSTEGWGGRVGSVRRGEGRGSLTQTDLTSVEGQAVDVGKRVFKRKERKLSKCLQDFAERASGFGELLPSLPSPPSCRSKPHHTPVFFLRAWKFHVFMDTKHRTLILYNNKPKLPYSSTLEKGKSPIKAF